MSKPPKSFTINDWEFVDRPREKLWHQGAAALSKAELIAIIIGSGSTQESAVELMKRILASVENNLQKLQQLLLEHLVKFKGIGKVKAVKIKAALALSKRLAEQKSKAPIVLTQSKFVYEHMRYELALIPHEEFWVLYLNQSSKLLEKFRLSQGGITATVVDIRLALKRAFELEATALILVHNHPSGSLTPSESDRQLTAQFKKVASYVALTLLEHLIISEKGYFSFADREIL